LTLHSRLHLERLAAQSGAAMLVSSAPRSYNRLSGLDDPRKRWLRCVALKHSEGMQALCPTNIFIEQSEQ